ncbi:MAG: PHP domain-containing protein, partial [Pseudomonadota bacterium]
MADFIHLHLHSAYSLSEGAIPISRLKSLCLEAGMPAVAVTDTNNLFGALEASEVLSAAGVQPITGVQLGFDVAALKEAEPAAARAPRWRASSGSYNRFRFAPAAQATA